MRHRNKVRLRLDINPISHLQNRIVQKRYVEASIHGSIPSIIHQTTSDIWNSDRRILAVGLLKGISSFNGCPPLINLVSFGFEEEVSC